MTARSTLLFFFAAVITLMTPASLFAAESAGDAGHLTWMLTSSALVLFMTAPGLAMFYSGLVRRKNVLGVMMQCLFLMGLMSVVWVLWGYSLCFGSGGNFSNFIGGVDHVGLRGLTMSG